jgi:ferredoxin-NADP reductase
VTEAPAPAPAPSRAPASTLPAPPPGPWQRAEVVGIRRETARAVTLRLALSEPRPHLAGQHYVVRLTAPDGYRASRSYSVASPPDDTGAVELTVERLEGGEVSSFLHDVVVVGDTLEVRGPIGGWFVWRGDEAALLLGGGSGLVPLMAMLRLARRGGTAPVRLVVSVRTPADLLYADELPGPEVTVVTTRGTPPGSTRPPGRLRAADLPPGWEASPAVYVCGPSGFADAAAGLVVAGGLDAGAVRVERFGPSA